MKHKELRWWTCQEEIRNIKQTYSVITSKDEHHYEQFQKKINGISWEKRISE